MRTRKAWYRMPRASRATDVVVITGLSVEAALCEGELDSGRLVDDLELPKVTLEASR